MNKINIDTDELKKEVYEILNNFKSKSEIYKYYGISDNKQGINYIKSIASEIGFDLNIYNERKIKPKRYCLSCGKEIINSDKRKKFCNHSCSATFNNKGVSRKEKNDNKMYVCPICGGKKHYKSEKCRICKNIDKTNVTLKRRLGEFINGKKYLAQHCSTIRNMARIILEKSQREKVCAFCKNHDFDEILEVHHIKGVLTFDSNSTVGEINSEDNLVWLCPNHHTMLEKGLIKL